MFLSLPQGKTTSQILIEALACGTPCVAFDIGGMGDLIETGRTGLLAPAFDVESLSRAIEEVLGWDAAAATARSRDFAEEHFDAKVVAAKHIALYERLMARKARAHRQEITSQQASEAQP